VGAPGWLENARDGGMTDEAWCYLLLTVLHRGNLNRTMTRGIVLHVEKIILEIEDN
jgi:hypothetical protein